MLLQYLCGFGLSFESALTVSLYRRDSARSRTDLAVLPLGSAMVRGVDGLQGVGHLERVSDITLEEGRVGIGVEVLDW